MTSTFPQSHGIPLKDLATGRTSNPRVLVLDSTNMDANYINTDPRQSLLGHNRGTSESSDERRLSALADHLGIEEIDAIHNYSSSVNTNTNKDGTKYDTPTVVLTQEQVETLIHTLEETRNKLRQLTYIGNILKPPKRPRTPRWIISNLLFITAVWQILGIFALVMLKVFNQHNKDERSTFIWTVTILVFFQALNLVLVFVTSVKLTKQFMHQTVTRSFLGQSFLSMTLLFAGLYTLVYSIKHDSFDGSHLDASDEIFSSVSVFANMLYFSISTATLCGAGHVIAASWYAQLMSGIQMLMSYVYFASVLSIAVHPPKNIQYKMRRGGNFHSAKAYGSINTV